MQLIQNKAGKEEKKNKTFLKKQETMKTNGKIKLNIH